MKCNVCRTPLTIKNIGYVKIVFRGCKENVYRCKKCHNITKK